MKRQRGVGGQVKGSESSRQVFLPGSGRDHGRIVSGESDRGEGDWQAPPIGFPGKPRPQFTVGGDSSGNQDAFRSQRLGCLEGFSLEIFDHRTLEGCDQSQGPGIAQRQGILGFGHGDGSQSLPSPLDRRVKVMNLDKSQYRGLDAAEGEGESSHGSIRSMYLLFDLGKAKGHRGRVSVSSEGIDPRTTRVAQPKQLSDLVKGFPGCIVERGPNIAVAPLLDEIEMGMAAGNDQGQRASLAQLTVRHQDGVNVSLQVVDGQERFVQGKGQRLGVSNSNQQCSGQARSLGDGNGVEIPEVDAGFVQRRPNDWHDIAQMFPRGEFRHHSTIGRMDRDL